MDSHRNHTDDAMPYCALAPRDDTIAEVYTTFGHIIFLQLHTRAQFTHVQFEVPVQPFYEE